MTTQYTPILKLALPVTGELSGTWGDVVNDNITSMVEQAVAGLATINTWTANSHTLTTANGTTAESRCAMLVAQDASGLSASGEIICPALSKLYVLKNATSYQITLKTAAGTGIAVASGETAFLFCDGTNVNACVTTVVNGHITGNLTVDGNTTLGNATSDTITATARFSSGILPSADNAYDLGSSGNSWKDLYIDGTAYMALVDINGGTIDGTSIGSTTPVTFIAVDNLSFDSNTIASTNTNGNIVLSPNGTGAVSVPKLVLSNGTSGRVPYLTTSGQVTDDADLTFDGTTLSVAGLTASGTVTLSGGTANGIPYLNASKVLTSGSALTFDGSNFIVGASAIPSGWGGSNKVAIKQSGTSAYQGLVINASSNDSGVFLGHTGTVATLGVSYGSTGAYTPLTFEVNGSEQMRLTSTGLGIGTSSPSAKLHLNGSALLQILQNDAAYIQFRNTAGADKSYIQQSGDDFLINNQSNGVIQLRTNNTIRATLDASGNLGIGKSPSYKFDVQSGNSGRIAFTAPTADHPAIYFLDNAGGYQYGTFRAYDFTFNNGTSDFLKIDSVGNVGIGTSSPAYKLDVTGALRIENTSATHIRLTNSASYPAILGQDGSSNFTITNGGLTRIVLDPSGNLGLGVTPSAWNSGYKALQIANNYGSISTQTGGAGTLQMTWGAHATGADAWTYSTTGDTVCQYIMNSGLHRWRTAPSGNAGDAISFTQAMTLDASGNLIIGDTQLTLITGIGAARTSSKGSADGMTVVGGAGNNTLNLGKSGTPSGSWVSFLSTGGTSYGNITVNGSGTAYNTTSDYRLKNITGPITGSGAYIDNLKPVEGTWKVDGTPFVGLIAHEVQEVSRTLVATGVKDGVETQTMDYSSAELIANMIAELKSLRARVAQLESK